MHSLQKCGKSSGDWYEEGSETEKLGFLLSYVLNLEMGILTAIHRQETMSWIHTRQKGGTGLLHKVCVHKDWCR